MQSVLIVIHLMIVVALVVTVLLQRSEGGALGVGGSGFMTGRGQANVLTRATGILAALFFATSLGLTILAKLNQTPAALIPSAAPAGEAPIPAPAQSNLLDQLKRLEDQRQSEPAAPASETPAPARPQSAPAQRDPVEDQRQREPVAPAPAQAQQAPAAPAAEAPPPAQTH